MFECGPDNNTEQRRGTFRPSTFPESQPCETSKRSLIPDFPDDSVVSAWRLRLLPALTQNDISPLEEPLHPSPSPTQGRKRIFAKVVSHAKYRVFQLAEVTVPRQLFAALVAWVVAVRSECAVGV